EYVLSFFFQAEDGIRDFHVTGVQTCALPISAGIVLAFWFAAAWMEPVGAAVVSSLSLSETLAPVLGFVVTFAAVLVAVFFGTRRSEERRVGKEWRARWRAWPRGAEQRSVDVR